MDQFGRERHWILGAVLTLLLAGAARLGGVASQGPIREACINCDGTGLVTTVIMQTGVTTSQFKAPCDSCSGSGYVWVLDERILKALPNFIRDLSVVVFFSLLGGLVWATKVVGCRLCDESGRLMLEVEPPEEAPSLLELRCVACQGRGGLTAIDRWVAGV